MGTLKGGRGRHRRRETFVEATPLVDGTGRLASTQLVSGEIEDFFIHLRVFSKSLGTHAAVVGEEEEEEDEGRTSSRNFAGRFHRRLTERHRLSLSFLSHCLPAWTEDPAGYPEAGAKRIALDGVGNNSPLALMSERHTRDSHSARRMGKSFDNLICAPSS